MKKILLVVVLAAIIFSGCIQEDKVKVEIRQIIPLPTGTVIVASAPVDINKSLESIVPRTGDNEIEENSSFAIPIIVKNTADENFKDTKILLTYEKEFIEKIHPYYSSKEPLKQLENNLFDFDKDLKASQETTLILAGRVRVLPKSLENGKVLFNISILDENNRTLANKGDSIIIKKKR